MPQIEFKEVILSGKGICYQALSLTKAQHSLIYNIMSNNNIASTAYQLRGRSHAFFQGGSQHNSEGWALLEFWTKDEIAIKAFIDFIHEQLNKQGAA